jgi:hypothetical protein
MISWLQPALFGSISRMEPKKMSFSTEASIPAPGLRGKARPVEVFLGDHDLGWSDLVRLMLTGRAPPIADIAGNLIIFGEDEQTWRTRERILAALAREPDGAGIET